MHHLTLTRSWPALAALGAALLYAAVGAGGITAGAAPLGITWVGIAVAHAIVGVLGLHRGTLPTPSIALAVFVTPALVWAALLAAGIASGAAHQHGTSALAASVASPADAANHAALMPLSPLALATLLSLGAAASSAAVVRRRTRRTRRARPTGRAGRALGRPSEPAATPPRAGGSYVVGLLIGSMALSALVVPGLAATDAGRSAVPHGTHSVGAPAQAPPAG